MSVYCILQVKYCITGVTVYMEMDSNGKKNKQTNLTDLSYLTAFFCIVNFMASHCKRLGTVYFGRNNVHFPIIILCVYVCVRERVSP